MINFSEALVRTLALPLPGLDAQLRMAPRPRSGWDPSRIPDGLRDAAALVLLYPGEGGPYLPLTVRSGGLRNHTGQVSLPGGGVEAGETIEGAALREAAEEIGIEPASVRVIGRLTELHIPVSGYLLRPVVGVAEARPDFVADEREVAELLEVPVDRLLDPSTVGREWRAIRHGATDVEVDVPYYDLGGQKVWGATAMVLAELVAILRGDHVEGSSGLKPKA